MLALKQYKASDMKDNTDRTNKQTYFQKEKSSYATEKGAKVIYI